MRRLRLFLPVSPDQPEVIHHPTVPVEAPPGQGERILVVEDNEAVRTLVVTVLEKLGYGIHSVGDGHAATAYVESEAEVDLLLSDICCRTE